jgi:hypothetical protein
VIEIAMIKFGRRKTLGTKNIILRAGTTEELYQPMVATFSTETLQISVGIIVGK